MDRDELGGGDGPEDYDLLWYFADKCTDTDSFNKRHKKGFCFTIGDASNHIKLTKEGIKSNERKTIEYTGAEDG